MCIYIHLKQEISDLSLGTKPRDVRLIFCESKYGRHFAPEAISTFMKKDRKTFALEKCELIQRLLTK